MLKNLKNLFLVNSFVILSCIVFFSCGMSSAQKDAKSKELSTHLTDTVLNGLKEEDKAAVDMGSAYGAAKAASIKSALEEVAKLKDTYVKEIGKAVRESFDAGIIPGEITKEKFVEAYTKATKDMDPNKSRAATADDRMKILKEVIQKAKDKGYFNS